MKVQKKILVVDDDLNNITIIKELLEDAYDLEEATSGEQALEIAQIFQPDIILVDIMMPGMDGYEVCKRLREDATLKYTKIIMVSARALVTERLKGYNVGADDYITKPFEGDELLAKIHIYLRLKHVEEIEKMRHEDIIKAMKSMRTPVTVAKNIISIVTSDISSDIAENIFKKKDPKISQQLKVANECMEHLERIIDNITDISEIYAGKVELKKTLYSIKSLILRVVKQLKAKTALTMITFDTHMPAEDLLVNIDHEKIGKILKYLIDDIIKISHEGDSIDIRVEKCQDKICVNIEGKRRIVENDKINELFEQATQIEKNTTSHRHSMNFELAIAKGLIELHNGSIWAENRPEGGTIFSFEIPMPTETKTATQPVLSYANADSEECY